MAIWLVVTAYRTELDVLKADLTFPTNILAAVFGDSRVETSFDEKEIPWLKNCGQSATPFQVTAEKVKIAAEMNPNLKLFIIDVWPHKFFEDKDDRHPFWPVVPNGVALIELRNRKFMPDFGDDFPVRLCQGVIRPGLKHAVFGFKTGDSQIAGGFRPAHQFIADGRWLNEESYTSERPHCYQGEITKADLILIDLLDYLKARDRNVVLTTTPIHPLWWKYRYTESFKKYFNDRMAFYTTHYGCPWLNRMHKHSNETEYWADGNHLNDIGAKVFSREIKRELDGWLSAMDADIQTEN